MRIQRTKNHNKINLIFQLSRGKFEEEAEFPLEPGRGGEKWTIMAMEGKTPQTYPSSKQSIFFPQP